MTYKISASTQHILNAYLAPGQQYLFYENCATAEHAAFFHRYLLGHLIGTVQLLEKWGCGKDLCYSGLFHSIYGTEAITAVNTPFTPLSLDRRNEVRFILGERVEHLVYLFCALERRTFFANLGRQSACSVLDRFGQVEVPLSRQDYRDLITLTLADWLEPVIGKEVHPLLVEEVKASYKVEFMKASSFFCPQAVNDFRSIYETE